MPLPNIKKVLAIGWTLCYNSLAFKYCACRFSSKGVKLARIERIIFLCYHTKNKKAGAFASAFLFFRFPKVCAARTEKGRHAFQSCHPSDYTCKTFQLQKYIACSRLQDTEKPRGVCPGACFFINCASLCRSSACYLLRAHSN